MIYLTGFSQALARLDDTTHFHYHRLRFYNITASSSISQSRHQQPESKDTSPEHRYRLPPGLVIEVNPLVINKTRFSGLGFSKVAPGLWRLIDTETGAAIGAQYARKDELLADLAAFAKERGFE